MRKRALLVIDVQNYYINKNTQNIPRKIENYIQENHFDFVLFTQFINHKDANMYRVFRWNKMMSPPDTDICSNLIQFTKKDTVFKKDTYSAFKSEKFKEFLKRHQITELSLCGLDSDACVLATAYEGFDLGYKIRILNELTASHSGKKYREYGLEIMNKNIQ